jgi:predicted DNA-binding protein (MmcQ/YjbR family)
MLRMAVKHPRVIDPTHPIVERVRGLCLAYPESAEVEAWGRPTFRAGKKIFALVSASMLDPNSLVFKPLAEERPAYLERDGFYSPPYWGPGGWLAISLDERSTDWAEVAEIIDTSYRQVALKRQLAQLDN